MTTGRVLQFDHSRGYGFVAADDGGEDIFLHASVLNDDPGEVVPGMLVEFQVMASDRGRKAYGAHLIADESGREQPSPAPPIPAPRPVPSPPLAQKLPAAAPPAADEEQMCEVLSQAEFGQELTEVLLNNAPALTGQQIIVVRQSVLEFAMKNGWVDI